MNRRDLFKFLAGIGLGAVTIETYERLYHIPMLETMFRKELEYWINQYNIAREEVERLTGKLRGREGEISSLRSDLTKSKEELEHLIQQYNTTKEEVSRLSEMLKQSEEEINNLKEKVGYWEAQYNTAREEVERLNSTINKIDELERESTLAIAYYRGRMDEAIRKLKEIIERYRVLLGDERISFESSTVKLLEDLRLTQEKLQKVLPYFPLILNFSWKPTKVVNDKIYNIKVIFEVISPLSSLEEVEVILIPVEYRYFITKYGMREEDYDKVFPEEEVRSVKIKPINLEREMFSVDFEDLKGGREYIVKARVKDVAGNEKRVAVKTPYIRQFENFGRELYDKGIIVSATYYSLYPDPHPWEGLEPMAVHPILGKYDVRDPIVQAKHIDWATGHGINTLVFSWGIFGDNNEANIRTHKNILNFLSNPLSSQVHFYLLYELPHRLYAAGIYGDENGLFHLSVSDSNKWGVIIDDFKLFNADFFGRENYLKIDGKPVVYLYWSKSLRGDVPIFLNEIRKTSKDSIFLICDFAEPGSATWIKEGHPLIEEYVKYFDGWSTWAAGWPDPHVQVPVEENFPYFLVNGYSVWSELADKYNRYFIPSIIPGFINLRDMRYPILPRNLKMFIKELEAALQYASSPTRNILMIRVDTFNEFGEATGIEPTQEEDYSYIEALFNLLRSKT